MRVQLGVYGVPVADREVGTYAPGVVQIVLTPDELHDLHEQTQGHPLARVEITITIDPREVPA